MPTSISNPATFSSVRTAFNTEGYGTSTSFYAYRQGGGIVPATSPFNAIGAGTSGDPLRLSQFSGFSVPSLYTAPTVSLGDHTLAGTSDNFEPLTSTIYFVLNSSGMSLVSYSSTATSAEVTIDGGAPSIPGDYNIETWLDSGTNSDVAVYVTQTSGSTLVAGSDSLGSYLNLGTTRQWGLQATRSTVGSQSKAATLSVSLVEAINTANVLDTATINISVSAVMTT